jgi:hypothetical protein
MRLLIVTIFLIIVIVLNIVSNYILQREGFTINVNKHKRNIRYKFTEFFKDIRNKLPKFR